MAQAQQTNGLSGTVPGVQSTTEIDGKPQGPGNLGKQYQRFGMIFLNEKNAEGAWGMGWCIDFGLPAPNDSQKYGSPQKLTHVATKDGRQIIPFEGAQRDSAIHMLKQANAAFRAGDQDAAKRYATALNVLVGSYPKGITDFVSLSRQGGINNVTVEDFHKMTGFRLVGGDGSTPARLEEDPAILATIPKAGPDEYITAIAPKNYTLPPKGHMHQRIVPIDQPGLNDGPTPEPEPKPEPKNPKLELKKYINNDDAQDAGKPAANTVEVAASSEMNIKYVVTNTGDVDLKGVKVSDVVTAGESKNAIQASIDAALANVAPFDLAVGAKHEFEITVKTPLNGDETHRNVAKAKGTADVPENTPVESNEDEANARTPKNFTPKIKTEAKWANQEEDVVTDTVSVSGLVEGETYVLQGQLINKETNASLGTSEQVSFVANAEGLNNFKKAADGSVSGTVTVQVPGASQLAPGQSGVVFETLTSGSPEAQKQKAKDLPSTAGEDVIAVHQDINDAKQTVTRDQIKPEPSLSLKKYINGDDAQDAGKENANTVLVQPASSMEIRYDVTNTGNVKLNNIKLSDKVTDGASKDAIQKAINEALAAIAPFDLEVGETVPVTIKVTTPLKGGEKHRNIAQATGTPDVPESTPVESNEDEANARTPKNFTPEVRTEAKWADQESGTVTDTVTVSGLVEGATYVLEGQLMNKADSSALGEVVSKEFVASEASLKDFKKAEDGSVSGTVTVEVPGADKLAPGQSGVVFETLKSSQVDASGNDLPEGSDLTVVATHHDINDAKQTVTKPEEEAPKGEPSIATSASLVDDAQIREGAIPADSFVYDTVTVTNVLPNTEYTLDAQLVLKPEGTQIDGATASQTFTTSGDAWTDNGDGTVSGVVVVKIPLKGSALADGQSAVAFETLKSDSPEAQEHKAEDVPATAGDNVIAVHQDINDAAQTVTQNQPKNGFTPSLTTSASPKDAADAVVTDTVSVSGLKSGAKYTLVGELFKKNADGTQGESLGKSDQVEFIAGGQGWTTNEDGSVSGTVTVKVPGADKLGAGESAVVFETLTSAEVDSAGDDLPKGADRPSTIAEHHDINDEAQTVTKPEEETPVNFTPKVFTWAEWSEQDGDIIADTVKVSGLVEGETYTLVGKLVNKDNKSTLGTSEPLEFVADSAGLKDFGRAEDGSVSGTVIVKVPGADKLKPGESGVVFETLKSSSPEAQKHKAEGLPATEGEDAIAIHHDINDDDQTVTKPEAPETPETTTPESTEPSEPAETSTPESTTPESTEPSEPAETSTPKSTVPSEPVTPAKQGEPALSLKKYINNDDAQDAGKDGANVVKVDPSSKMKIRYDVTNTGDVDLKNVTITDKVTDGASTDVIQKSINEALAKVEPFDLPVGRTHKVTIEVDTPVNGGEIHRNVAEAKGETVPAEGSESTPVTSNEDEANAETPKTEESETPAPSTTKPEQEASETPAPKTTEPEGETSETPAPKTTEPEGETSETPAPKTTEPEGETSETPTPSTTEPAAEVSTTTPAPSTTEPEVPVVPGQPEQPVGKPEIATWAELEDEFGVGAIVNDTVGFKNLAVGEKYTLVGELYCQPTGLTTGATNQIEFTPTMPNGYVTLPIAITDATCETQVVFETLLDKEGNVVATHHDINDAAQTVSTSEVLNKPKKEEVITPGEKPEGDKPAGTPTAEQPGKESGVKAKPAPKASSNAVTVDKNGKPSYGKGVSKNTGRVKLKSIPSGPLALKEGMPNYVG